MNPTMHTADGANPTALAKIEHGMMRALLRHLRGEVSLHASAVVIRGRALVFMGESGAGKSTLAATLACAEQRAFALLSDDCLFVDGVLAIPSETFAFLDEGASGKRRVHVQRTAKHAAPIAKLVRLSFGNELAIHPLRGVAVGAALTQALVRFVLDEHDVQRADMNRLAALATNTEAVSLVRPRGFEHVDATLDIIEKACVW